MPGTVILIFFPMLDHNLIKQFYKTKYVTLMNTNIASAINPKLVYRLKMKNEVLCFLHRLPTTETSMPGHLGVTYYQDTGQRIQIKGKFLEEELPNLSYL